MEGPKRDMSPYVNINQELQVHSLVSLNLAVTSAKTKLLPANRVTLSLRQVNTLINDLQASQDI